MADYRTHITTSGILGVGYGLAATLGAGFSPVHGALAAVLTGVAGMLPDLDSDSGRPVREVFGLLAAVAPLVLLNRLEQWGGGREAGMLLAVLLYIAIRYGASTLLHMATVHRGMYHSIPAMVVAAEITYLAYMSDSASDGVRWLMALGVALGFGSHLVLDEIYSVRWNGALLSLKPSAGSAVKWVGKSWPSNILAYGLALTLGYGVLVDGGWQLMPDAAGGKASSASQQPSQSNKQNVRGDAHAKSTESSKPHKRPGGAPDRNGAKSPLADDDQDLPKSFWNRRRK